MVMSATIKQCPKTLDSFFTCTKKNAPNNKLNSSLDDFVVEEELSKNNSSRKKKTKAKKAKAPLKSVGLISSPPPLHSLFAPKKSSNSLNSSSISISDDEPMVISFDDFLSEKVDSKPQKEKTKTKTKSTTTSVGQKTKPISKKNSAADGLFSEGDQKNPGPTKRKNVPAVVFSDAASKKRKTSSSSDVIIIDSTPNKSMQKSKDNKLISKTKNRYSDDIIEVTVIKSADRRCKQSVHDKDNVKPQILSTSVESTAAPVWTEKHRPLLTDQLLVGKSGVRKLVTWLENWKKQVEKEKVFLQKQASKQQKQKQKKSSYDDDSDFHDSEEELEDDGLCNTVILTGSTGIGKTATVYTCAHELGFKVLEINASSKRGSKQILTQLQEATQSYLVHATSGTKGAPASKSTADHARNFFRIKSPDAPRKKVKSGVSRVADILKEKISLILIDEVDAVLDEDKFFWAGIESIMSISKRPVILTSSDSSVAEKIEGNYQKVFLKSVSPEIRYGFLDKIASSERVDLRKEDVLKLLSSATCDVRHCLLSLQFWSSTTRCAVKRDQQAPTPRTKRKSRNKRRRGSEKVTSGCQDSGEDKVALERFYEKCLGLSDILREKDSTSSTDLSLFESLCQLNDRPQHLDRLISSISHTLLHCRLHLLLINRFKLLGFDEDLEQPQSPLPIHLATVDHSIGGALCSDVIDGDLLSLAYNRRIPNYGTQELSCDDNSVDCPPPQPIDPLNDSVPDDPIVQPDIDLSCLASYLETVSSCDILNTTFEGLHLIGSGSCQGSSRVLEGTSDEAADCSEPSYFDRNLFCDVQSSLQVLSLRHTQCHVTRVLDSRPVRTFCTRDSRLKTNRSYRSLLARLSYCNGGGADESTCAMFNIDYLPYLRCICRLEENRKQLKASRRFFHFLDQNQLYPQATDIVRLASEFTVKPLEGASSDRKSSRKLKGNVE